MESYGQRYAANGAPAGAEFRVNTVTFSDQLYSSVTALDDGGFLVTWSSFGQDGSGYGIYGQRFGADGAAVGIEFRINQITDGEQFAESHYGSETVAQLADGRLVQTWTGSGVEEVFVRLIDVPALNTAPTITSNGGGDAAGISIAENTTLVTTVTAEDADAGQTPTYSIVGGADAAQFSIDSATGVLSFITALNYEAPADAGVDNTYEVTVQVSDGAGGTDTQTIAVTLTNENELPVVAGVATGAVNEDGGAGATATGQLTAADPDAGTNLTWSIDGGTTAAGADYRFALDNLTIKRNGVDILNDTFDNGVALDQQPGAPAYGVSGTFIEEGGRLILDASGALPVSGVGTPDPFVGHGVTVQTSIQPGVQGLRLSTNFAVEGRFDLLDPGPREAYGIRLGDHAAAQGFVGDDVVDLLVRKFADGSLRGQLRDVDFTTDATTPLGSVLLEPPQGADQIVLRLTHSTSNPGVVVASFDFWTGGVPIANSTVTLLQTGRIFTSGVTDDWTRASVIAFAPEITDSALLGEYGTLNVDQAGAWTYTLANGQANVQALAVGETVSDPFSVRASDGAGGVTTQTVSVAVTGVNDAPTVATAIADHAAEEGADFFFAVPAGTFVDVDNGDTIIMSATLAGDAPLPTWLNFDPGTGTFLGMPSSSSAGSYVVVVKATDQSGSSVASSFTLTVGEGTPNQAPVAANDTASAVTEEGIIVAHGNVLANNSDPGDVLTIQSVSGVLGSTSSFPALLTGNYGFLQIQSDGQYFYTLDAAAQSLGQGQEASDTFSYVVVDQAGSAATATLTIPITGTAPTATPDVATVEENGVTTATGNVLDNDTGVNGASLTVVTAAGSFNSTAAFPAVLQGNYGTLTLAADGTYTYELAANSALVQGLGAGQQATDTFFYAVTDGAGTVQEATSTLTVTINGSAPTVAVDTATVSEEGTVTTTGNVLENDSSVNGAGLTVVTASGSFGSTAAFPAVLQGNYGTLTIAADGSYTYDLASELGGRPGPRRRAAGDRYLLLCRHRWRRHGTGGDLHADRHHQRLSPDGGSRHSYRERGRHGHDHRQRARKRQ